MNVNFLNLLLTVILAFFFDTEALSPHYYDHTCPKADQIVTNAVKKAMANDKTVPAALSRMHFHDCFIRGCDASVLLDSKGKNKAEKDGPPNISLHAFYVIDNAKKALEEQCPGVVSCADIVSLAARYAVALVIRRANMGSAKREKRWKSIKSNRNKTTTSSYFQHLSAATKFWPKRPFYARSCCSLWHYRFSIYLKYTVQGCRFAI
ncbi:hypothetical protein HID58_060116 [Brassica napus]|uniref:peroxidase n=1 Tax=Brassica napus TaxID=3708 RepID=A0ABQ7ZVU6_BRANA|nr:hypothetical protein HID58_060116 [Brassica napus]